MCSLCCAGEGDPEHRGPQAAADHQHAAEGRLLRGESSNKVKTNITPLHRSGHSLAPDSGFLVDGNTVLIANLFYLYRPKSQICLRGFQDTLYP